jgi:glycerophosphoryl diester phosphodiesterase
MICAASRLSSRTGAMVLTLMLSAACAAVGEHAATGTGHSSPFALDDRPLQLLDALNDGPLKERLDACRDQPIRPTRFSIGHRGAPLGFPEHTEASYRAAAGQGAGVLECDVTFTADRVLVCRHAQCDLHSTTNILASPLATRCREPFTPADPASGRAAGALCCTSELTLAEFRTLCGRRDVVNGAATSIADYLAPTSGEACGKLMTHAESIALFDTLGTAMTPELKAPEVAMPFGGSFTQADYADALIDAYRRAGIAPGRVWPQSFSLADVQHWITRHPDFAEQAVYLDGRGGSDGFDPSAPESLHPTMDELAAMGVRIIAPPIWVLLTIDDGRIVPSAYARAARAAGLGIITWTLERSGSLADGGGYYYQSVSSLIDDDGDVYTVLDVLAREVGVIGVFSDWPATVTYYANCMGL